MTIETIKKFVRKNWITVWLVVAAITLSGGLVLAKYATEHNVVRRVIATDGGAATRFTSNYLFLGDSNQQIRNVASTDTRDVVFDLFIYNYSLNNPTQWYKSDLDYSLEFSVTSIDGRTTLTASDMEALIGSDSIEVYTVTGEEENMTETSLVTINKDNLDSVTGSSHTISQTIVRSQYNGTSNRYKLVLPNSVVGKDIALKVVAKPARKHGDISDIVLTSRFAAASQNIVLTTGWAGSYNDDTTVALSSYEGFNFSISGSGNSTGTLSWRYDLLEPNKNQMIDLFGVDPTVSGNYTDNTTTHMRSITIPLSSEDNAGHYDFQMYIISKSAKSVIDQMSWSDFENTCTFVDSSN